MQGECEYGHRQENTVCGTAMSGQQLQVTGGPITEVKHHQVGSVPGWVTAWDLNPREHYLGWQNNICSTNNYFNSLTSVEVS